MKKTLFYTLSIFMLFVSNVALSQTISVGIAPKASTMGLGGDIILQFRHNMSVRAGFDKMGYSFPYDFNQENIEYHSINDLKTGSLSALLDIQLVPLFFVTTGLAVNNLHLVSTGNAKNAFEYGDITISPEKIGTFTVEVRPGLRISPYAGIGFGRTLSAKSRVGFAFEIGTYYMGSPKVSIEADGLISPTANPDHGQAEIFENQLSQYYLYPILRMSVNFKIIDI